MNIGKRKKFIILVMCSLLISSMYMSVLANEIQPYAVTGTERPFEVELPINYQNASFQRRIKETNETKGYVRLTEKPSSCNGIYAWFYGADGFNSDIVRVPSTGVNYWITYSGYSHKGITVYLGVEDYDNPSINNRHTVKGIVNYK